MCFFIDDYSIVAILSSILPASANFQSHFHFQVLILIIIGRLSVLLLHSRIDTLNYVTLLAYSVIV